MPWVNGVRAVASLCQPQQQLFKHLVCLLRSWKRPAMMQVFRQARTQWSLWMLLLSSSSYSTRPG
jgi:hypothetical protein